MISKNLIRNLLEAGLQPFPYKSTNKKGYFNNEYYINKEITGQTATNFDGYFDINKFFKVNAKDCSIGLALKVSQLRHLNKGFVVLDFDLKGDDDFSVFDSAIKHLKKNNLLEQYEIKNNGKGMHVFIRLSDTDIEKIVSQGKIFRGKESFIEVLTAGKFLRLCPNGDYSVSDGAEHINFLKVPSCDLDLLLQLSTDDRDRVLKTTTHKHLVELTKLDIDFSKMTDEFETEEENLIYTFIKSQKLDYSIATKIASGLGHMKLKKLYLKAIPENQRHIFDGLFLGGFNSDINTTSYMTELIKGLKLNKDKIKIKGKYIDTKDMRKIFESKEKKILAVAPTGTGKTFSSLQVAREKNLKIIFTMPNKATVEQQANEHKVAGAFDNKNIMIALEKSSIVICTLNKLTQIQEDFDLSDYILINDEAHTSTTTSDYRAEIIYKAEKMQNRFKKVIDITATPEPLFIDDYERVFTFIKADTKKYKASVFECNNKKETIKKLVEVLDDSKVNVLCLNNDIAFNTLYSENRDNCISWNSKTKSDPIYKELVKTNIVPKAIKKILTTDIFSAGFNINNTGKWKIVIRGVCDPSTIKQLVARFRKVEEIEIVLIKVVSKVADIFYDKYQKIKNIRFAMKKLCEEMNLGSVAGVGINFIQDKFFTYEKKVFEVFNPSINRNCWKTWFSMCSVEDLFSLFDANSISVKIFHSDPDEDGECDFSDDLEEVKETRKIMKNLKKAKTFALISEKQLNSAYYLESEYDDGVIKRYLEFRTKWDLSHNISYKFTEDTNLIDTIIYKILARYEDTDFKNNQKYMIAKKVYKGLSPNDAINCKEYCKEKKLNVTEFRKAVKSIWDYEEIRTGRSRFWKLKSRNISTIFSKKEEFEILKSGVVFR